MTPIVILRHFGHVVPAIPLTIAVQFANLPDSSSLIKSALLNVKEPQPPPPPPRRSGRQPLKPRQLPAAPAASRASAEHSAAAAGPDLLLAPSVVPRVEASCVW